MVEQNKKKYKPDTVSPPGDTLADLLEERGMTQAELAERTGRPVKTVNEIIKGKAAITPETAIQLERVLGTKAEFWNQREANYRSYLARQRESEHLISQKNWLKQFPTMEMETRGWIRSCEKTITAQMIRILNFFGVANPEQWQAGWTKKRLAFRKSMNLASKAGATSVWLRQGEIDADKISCQPFNHQRLLEIIPRIRELTNERDPKVFIPKLTEFCASCGVAVALVKPFKGVPVYGSSSWLNPEKGLIQLSVRGKTADLLWFTVFHELGHLLKHSKKELFVEIEGTEKERSPEEIEADDFAAETLIPENKLNSWLQNTPVPDAIDIKKFSQDLGIASGIVVGRLQHKKIISFNSTLNRLKFRFEWKDEK